MMKIYCDKCEQEITDPNEVSTVFEDGEGKHYHKSDCFIEAREKLQSVVVSPPMEPVL